MYEETDRLRRIAQWYYLEDMTLREIASRLNVSIATISRSLKRAKEAGIVRITITDDGGHFDALEREIETRFGLRECIITDSAERLEVLYAGFAPAVAELIYRYTPDGGLLGTSWGETLAAVARNLPVNRPKAINVVPVIGALGAYETGVYPNSIAQAFATATGGRAYIVNMPAVVDSDETAARIRGDRAVQSIRELWTRIDTVVLGASSLDSNASISHSGTFTDTDLQSIRESGTIAAINFVMIGADGAVVSHPLEQRILNLPVSALRSIKTVILAAAGTAKIRPVIAALRSSLVTCLVTDELTARGLLDQIPTDKEGTDATNHQ